MKFLILSEEGDSVGLAYRMLAHEGHDVLMWTKTPVPSGDGIVDKVKSAVAKMAWADIVISDSNVTDKEAQLSRKLGKPTYGGTTETASWEDDRAKGMKELESWGLNLPEWFGPFTLEQAEKFIKENPGQYVFKPNDSTTAKEATFVSSEPDSSDMIAEFSLWKENGLKVKTGILQVKVEGKECAIGAFGDGNGFFVKPYFINFEHKRTNNDDRGVNCGETGTIGYWCDAGKLVEIMDSIDGHLPIGYNTYFDINMIVTENEYFVLEATVRDGYPTTYLIRDSVGMEIGKMFEELAKGEIAELPIKSPWVCGIVACISGFPFEDSFEIHGANKKVPDLESLEDVWAYELVFDKKLEEFKTPKTGVGSPLVFTGIGDSLDECIKEAYKDIHELPSSFFFRTDIGSKLKKDLSWFYENKWIK